MQKQVRVEFANGVERVWTIETQMSEGTLAANLEKMLSQGNVDILHTVDRKVIVLPLCNILSISYEDLPDHSAARRIAQLIEGTTCQASGCANAKVPGQPYCSVCGPDSPWRVPAPPDVCSAPRCMNPPARDLGSNLCAACMAKVAAAAFSADLKGLALECARPGCENQRQTGSKYCVDCRAPRP